MFSFALKHVVSQALERLGQHIAPEDIPLEFPADLSNGDFASSVALKYFASIRKSEKEALRLNNASQVDVTVARGTIGVNDFVAKSPREYAERIVAEMGAVSGVAKIDVAGPGFINFTLDGGALASVVTDARKSGWGRGDFLEGRTVMMEYTDPNPFKEFHIGHLMPNAIGESISRIFEQAGAKVLRANYQGDVGVHVAKSIYVQLKKGITDPTIEDLAASYPEGSNLYETDPEVKKEIDALNKVIYEKSDPKVNDLYDKGRALSLEHFEELYRILGTKFDFYFFESVTGPEGLTIVRAHKEIFEESEGAVVFKGEQYGLHTRVFVNRLGLPTYEAKELGLASMKLQKADFDFTMTITAQEQADYFKVTSKAIQLAMPEAKGKVTYKTHGMMRFADGKMSSRKGNVITGESLLMDLIEESKKHAAESRADDPVQLAEEVAVAAIKFQILRQSTNKDIIFDRERALSIEGDSGPYVQYAHARTCAILEKAVEAGIAPKYDQNEPISDVVRFVLRFPEECARAAREVEPHYIVQYMTVLAAMFNSWYAKEQILDGTDKAAHKLAIVDTVRATLATALHLMGAKAPQKM